MSEDKTEEVATGECGACRAVIPLDSTKCPECNISFTGVSDEALGECGACGGLVPLDSTKCTHCGTVFIADDVVDVLRNWLATTGITIPILFNKFDKDGDGQIDSSELKSGLLSLNLADLPPSQVERLIETIDADGDGRIDLAELHKTITGDDLPEDETNDDSTVDMDEPEEEGDAESEEEHETDSEEEVETETEEVEDDTEDETEQEELESESDLEEEATEDSEEEGETDEPESEDEEVAEEETSEVENDSIEESSDEDEETEETHSEEVESSEEVPLIRKIADAMDEMETSPAQFFKSIDQDANGRVDVVELMNELNKLFDEEIGHEAIEEFLSEVDDDNDRTVDMIEFITALENLADADEATDDRAVISKPSKPFPTDMQKRMMGKQWNEYVWPLIHLAFGLFIALWVVNGFGVIVDGTGGPIELETKGNLLPPAGLAEGDSYPCDPAIQEGDCKNSLTPLSGKSSSMPAGFYWDGILFMIFGAAGLVGSLYMHLVLMPTWRGRAKAMKEVQDDQADASNESESEDDNIEDEMEEALEEDFEEEELDDDSEDDSKEEEHSEEADPEGEGEIDIGSHIGLTLEDEEVFGTIIEFDDEDETVTIEEDETGDIITGYQEDMFVE